jgi:hypothetical protein
MLVALLALLAVADASAPELISVDVGLVRVTSIKPGTNEPWAVPQQKSQGDGCGLFALAAGALTGGPGALISKTLCASLADTGTGAQTHSETDPNIYVKLTSGRSVFRSYTVPKTRSHRFNFRVIVPVAAIPKPGLELNVVNDDGSPVELPLSNRTG